MQSPSGEQPMRELVRLLMSNSRREGLGLKMRARAAALRGLFT